MKANVVYALADFLGALGYQVEAWDRAAIEILAGDTGLFRAFQAGSDYDKWCIYAGVKRASLAYGR